MKKIKMVFCLCMSAALLFGCEKKVVTVADIYSEDKEETSYIEIKELELKTTDSVSEGEDATQYCVVAIPAGYIESEEIPGMYIHERNPLDSSNVYYSVFSQDQADIDYSNLTAASYEKAIENAYEKSLDTKVDIKVSSFEKQEVEGFPSYIIRTSFANGEAEVEQLIYLIIADKIYSITYSQAADDELLADFEVLEGKIRLVRK